MKKEGVLAVVGVIVVGIVIALVVISAKKEIMPASQKVGEEKRVENSSESSTPKPANEVPKPALVLVVSSPANGAVVSTGSVTVKGTTTLGAVVVVNDVDVDVLADGSFSQVVTLSEGENVIVISASDEWGIEKDVNLTVTYQK